MRDLVAVGVRAVVFAVLGLALREDPAPAGPPDAGGLILLVVIAVIALLWGVLDGLWARGTVTRTMLRWVAVAPATTLFLALGGGVVDTAGPEAADVVRWLAGLVAMLYFVLVLPAGLGVVLGAGAQSLDVRRPGRSSGRGNLPRRP
jgi:hypothetical protein